LNWVCLRLQPSYNPLLVLTVSIEGRMAKIQDHRTSDGNTRSVIALSRGEHSSLRLELEYVASPHSLIHEKANLFHFHPRWITRSFTHWLLAWGLGMGYLHRFPLGCQECQVAEPRLGCPLLAARGGAGEKWGAGEPENRRTGDEETRGDGDTGRRRNGEGGAQWLFALGFLGDDATLRGQRPGGQRGRVAGNMRDCTARRAAQDCGGE